MDGAGLVKTGDRLVLAVNCGSSSLRLSAYAVGAGERLHVTGQIDRIGQARAGLRLAADGREPLHEALDAVPDHANALRRLLQEFEAPAGPLHLAAVGHRIVHGGPAYREPVRITESVLSDLARTAHFAPLHVPPALSVVRLLRELYPRVPHVACFDTGFHRSVPDVAKLFALPRRYAEEGIIRYGFHGLSFEFIMEALASVAGRDEADGRIIIAHLGNGCSMAAVRAGVSVDTTMGLTPTGGLMMGTRCGDLDPGAVQFLMARDGLSAADIDRILNRESGLLGVSGICSDMRTLLDQERTSPAAAQAVDLFCYQARKHLGALVAALGGLDTLVFTGGMGEHAPQIRERIAAPLQHLGIELDAGLNKSDAPLISTKTSRVRVRVLKTNEELMICRHTCRVTSAEPAPHATA
jgi:acetate kinase